MPPKLLLFVVLAFLSLCLTGCSSLGPAPTQTERIAQAQAFRDTLSVAEADIQVLCQDQALDTKTCDDLHLLTDTPEPIVSQLQADASSPTSDPAYVLDFPRLFYDLQPRVLDLVLRLSRHKANS